MVQHNLTSQTSTTQVLSVVTGTDLMPSLTSQGLFSAENLKVRLSEFIEGEKPFLRAGFTLTDMALEIDVPRHVLSHFINKEYGMNFNSLINSFRVEYLKSIPILDPEWRRLTLEALGRKAGFNSRNTLIKAFKKCTGECPSEYFSRSAKFDVQEFSFAGSLMRAEQRN